VIVVTYNSISTMHSELNTPWLEPIKETIIAIVDLNRGNEVSSAINLDKYMIAKKPTAIERQAAPCASRLVGRFCRDTGGVMAILVALLIPMVIGMMGLTADVGIWYAEKRALQDTTDAAALAGGGEVANGSNAAIIVAVVTADATRNNYDPATDFITINNPPTSGPNTGNEGSVEIIITRQMPLFFTTAFFNLIGASNQQFNTTARSVANTAISGDFCILGLDPTTANAVQVSGNGTATLNCGVAVNSDPTTGNALCVGGNATLTTTSISTVGTVGDSGGCGGTLNSESPPVRGGSLG